MASRAVASAANASCPGWATEVLNFWFSKGPAEWFMGGEKMDEQCKQNFLDLHARLSAAPAPSSTPNNNDLSTFCASTPRECFSNAHAALAGVIVYDQFPRNMFRKTPRAFMTDPLALAVSKYAVANGLDKQLDDQQKIFLYMPHMHSEVLADQEAGLELFKSTQGEFRDKLVEHGTGHRDIVARFGRFPHRNAVLGRESTEEEIAFCKEHPGFGQ